MDPDERLDNYQCAAADLYLLGDTDGREVYVLEISRSGGETFFGGTRGLRAQNTMGYKTREEVEQWLTNHGAWCNYGDDNEDASAWIVEEEKE